MKRRKLTRRRCKTRMKKGLCKCPRFVFIHFRSAVAGISNRSTTAVNNTIVIGIPIKA